MKTALEGATYPTRYRFFALTERYQNPGKALGNVHERSAEMPERGCGMWFLFFYLDLELVLPIQAYACPII